MVLSLHIPLVLKNLLPTSFLFFPSSSYSLDCFFIFLLLFWIFFLLFYTLIYTFSLWSLYCSSLYFSLYYFTHPLHWLAAITVWETTGNIQQSSKCRKMTESFLSETWRIPAIPFISNAKEMLTIFRNQPEVSPLCILNSTDLTMCTSNDTKNGKHKQKTVLGEN